MIVYWECGYCKSSIVSGQRWVREKVYDSALNGREPSYNHYHIEPLAGQEQSCWQRRQAEHRSVRTNVYAA